MTNLLEKIEEKQRDGFWREIIEKKLGSEGLQALDELHKEYKKIDQYQISKIFPRIGRTPSLIGVLDSLNWISLEVTKPKLPVYTAMQEKIEELERYLEKLKEEGYFFAEEPERWKRLVNILGLEKAKEMF